MSGWSSFWVNSVVVPIFVVGGLYTTGSWWDHKPTNDDHYELFPIPEKSISVSNVLKQNPGYGGGNEMTKEEAGIYSVKQID